MSARISRAGDYVEVPTSTCVCAKRCSTKPTGKKCRKHGPSKSLRSIVVNVNSTWLLNRNLLLATSRFVFRFSPKCVNETPAYPVIFMNEPECLTTKNLHLVAESSVNLQARVDQLTPSLPPSPSYGGTGLARASCGHLVPQDPTDEPAAKLLERIRLSELPPRTCAQRGISLCWSHVEVATRLRLQVFPASWASVLAWASPTCLQLPKQSELKEPTP